MRRIWDYFYEKEVFSGGVACRNGFGGGFQRLRPVPKGISSIEKTSSVGLIDYYTITYTDGTTSTFTVTNGKDGEDGQNATEITVDDVYEFYKQTNPDASKEEFLNSYLTVECSQPTQGDLTALSSLFCSGMKIYSIFNEAGTYISSSSKASYSGSAVLYKVDADYSYILTNYHMIYDANATSTDKSPEKIFAYMYGSNYSPVKTTSGDIIVQDDYALTCEYVGGSAECDVAIIKVETSQLTKKYPHAKEVTINESYQVGQTVYAFGNPDGLGLSLTKGIVSVDIETVTLDIAGTRTYYLLRTDADLDHGSSGGGLFNEDGELVALCNSGDDDVTSINYAIPASTVIPCAEGILYYNNLNADDHSTYRLQLGITVQEKNCRYVYDSKTKTGNIVANITVAEAPSTGSVATQVGIQSGDIIKAIAINGTRHEITRMYHLSNVLMGVRVGDSVEIIYERGGEEVTSSAYTATSTNFVGV